MKKAGLKAVPFELTAADKNEKSFEKRLKKAKFDVVFIALHGGFGEDGTLQGLLDQWGIPYTGSGALACGLSIPHGAYSRLFNFGAQAIPSAPWHALHTTTDSKNWLKEIKLALPFVVKPADVIQAIGVRLL